MRQLDTNHNDMTKGKTRIISFRLGTRSKAKGFNTSYSKWTKKVSGFIPQEAWQEHIYMNFQPLLSNSLMNSPASYKSTCWNINSTFFCFLHSSLWVVWSSLIHTHFRENEKDKACYVYTRCTEKPAKKIVVIVLILAPPKNMKLIILNGLNHLCKICIINY